MITVTNVLKIAVIFMLIFFKNFERQNVQKACDFLISTCDHVCVNKKRIQFFYFHLHAVLVQFVNYLLSHNLNN